MFRSRLGFFARLVVPTFSFWWTPKAIPEYPSFFYLFSRTIIWLALPIAIVPPPMEIWVVVSPPLVFARWEKTGGICLVHGIIVNVPVQVYISATKLHRVFVQEPPRNRIVVSAAVVAQAGFGIEVSARVLEGVRDTTRRSR